ncbi:hypothetical protein KIPB_012949, partial [Kipferlia bialata]|eukprot:g12949.t1
MLGPWVLILATVLVCSLAQDTDVNSYNSGTAGL